MKIQFNLKMVFNAPAHRNNLQTLQNYVATAVFITHLGWKQDGSGHTLVDKSDREEKVCIVVAKVLDYRMNCSPIGSYRKEYPPLAKAKFQFSVGKPEEGALAKDFDEAIKTLSKAQGTIATTQDRRNMLVTEGSDNNIRFTAPIFQKRVDFISYIWLITTFSSGISGHTDYFRAHATTWKRRCPFSKHGRFTSI